MIFLVIESFLNELNITNLNNLMHENHMFSIDKFSNLNIESNERNSLINHHKVFNELDSQEDHEEVFQLNVACQLWWPANHSDIFIYAAPVSNGILYTVYLYIFYIIHFNFFN